MEPDTIRLTESTRRVLRLFLDAKSAEELSGGVISALTKLHVGVVYRILHRLEETGWLQSRLEAERTAFKAARPRRRYYRMTAPGRKQAKERQL